MNIQPETQDPIVPAQLATDVRVLNAVKEEEIRLAGRAQAVKDKSRAVRTIVDAWKKQQEEERKLRARYATWLLLAMSFQVVCLIAAFFLIGTGTLKVEKWVATAFMVGIFGEVAAMALIVVKYLFPPVPRDIAGLLDKL
jgi:ABC-type transport system involved in cytochrome bd biosynthesis fused ATPase/permease subunit